MPEADSPKLGKPLKRAFFARSVHEVAPDLIGATLLVNGVGGIIVESRPIITPSRPRIRSTGRRRATLVMFGPPGFVYVYRSYGIHWCVNFVCEKEGSASAVLIRALEPTHGIAAMRGAADCMTSGIAVLGAGQADAKRSGLPMRIMDLAGARRLEVPPFALHARTGKLRG
jgi:DNA-3-methyladenine glycosylase